MVIYSMILRRGELITLLAFLVLWLLLEIAQWWCDAYIDKDEIVWIVFSYLAAFLFVLWTFSVLVRISRRDTALRHQEDRGQHADPIQGDGSSYCIMYYMKHAASFDVANLSA